MPFQVAENVPASVFVTVLLVAAVIAVLLTLSVLLTVWKWHPQLIPTLSEGPTWSFRDSWASNLTALGAILGTVLAASGFLADVMPGLSTGTFVGFSLVFAFLLVVAPLVFTLCSPKAGDDTTVELFLAGAIVLRAVIGELLTVVELLRRGGVPTWVGWVAFAGSIAVLGFYTRASVAQVINASKSAKQDPVAAATAALAEAAVAVVAAESGPADVELRLRSATGEVYAVAPFAEKTAAGLATGPLAGRVSARRSRPAAML